MVCLIVESLFLGFDELQLSIGEPDRCHANAVSKKEHRKNWQAKHHTTISLTMPHGSKSNPSFVSSVRRTKERHGT